MAGANIARRWQTGRAQKVRKTIDTIHYSPTYASWLNQV